MPFKTLFAVESQEFDYYFANEIENITPEAKEKLPLDINFKLFRGAGRFQPTSMSKLNFLGKLFILWKALKKRWYIVIEDEERGISVDQFNDFKKEIKSRNYSVEKAKGFKESGYFVLGAKELLDGFEYHNRISGSPAYNYLTKGKNIPENKAGEWRKESMYAARFLAFWEGHKKGMVSQLKISVPELYVLLYMYGRGASDIVGSVMYREVYKQAFHSSPAKIKTAFGTLQARGFIVKAGENKGATLRITPTGIAFISGVVSKYGLNC